jgi:glycosyltransferase involved in cell wall biosynthesis
MSERAATGPEPLVSVVVPAYNAARYLPSALDSVLTQDYPRVEVIVVDDGSTDDTTRVMSPYVAHGVRYLRQPNAGAGAARDAGVQAATGPLVAFLDSDDAWLPGKLARQVGHLMQHLSLGFVGGAYVQTDADDEPLAVVPVPNVACGDLFDALLVRNFVNTSTVVARKECFTAVGGFGRRALGQDWDTWLRIARRYPIGFVTDVVAHRRAHDASLSHVHASRRFASDTEILGDHLRSVRPAWKRPIIKARSRATTYYFLGAGSHARGDRRAARSLMVRSLALDPVSGVDQKLAVLLKSTVTPQAYETLRRSVHRRRAGDVPTRRR